MKSEAILMLEKILTKCKRKPSGCLVCYFDLDKDGYSHIRFERKGKKFRVHRLMMHLVKDFDLDSKLLILHNDNICNSKACIEVDHLKVGTVSENAWDYLNKPNRKPHGRLGRFKSHCPQGHEYTLENTYIGNKDDRQCLTCRRARRSKKEQ